jgi:transposase
MRTSAAREKYSEKGILFLAIESGSKQWKIGTKAEIGQQIREKTIAAWDVEAFKREVSAAKERWGLDPEARVVSCYEAGRDGFSVHRFLTGLGAENAVFDPGSVETTRKSRRAKTDRVDLRKMTDDRIRTFEGEERWKECRVPGLEEEDARQLHRELRTLKVERMQHRNRIQSLLATMGRRGDVGADFGDQIEKLRCYDGTALRPALRARLEREWARLKLVEEQIRELKTQRRRQLRESEESSMEVMRKLMQLRGIGEEGAWRLGRELFCWRSFENRRQVGALVGLAPTPHQSGELDRELGISKAGSTWIRPLMIELSWLWLRLQSQSELSRWYQRRFGSGKRSRKVGIVALARKLLVALWRYVTKGQVPAGATLKPGIA